MIVCFLNFAKKNYGNNNVIFKDKRLASFDD
jgi:hypothetical protein